MARGYSIEEKQRIIELHQQGLFTTQIAKIVGRSQTGIERFLKRSGFEMNKKGKLSKDDESKIVEMYKQGFDCSYIWREYYKELFNSPSMIEKVVKRAGLSRGVWSKEIVINHRYFENIDNHRKAYWIGILLADGCIFDPEKGNLSPTISLSLNEEDGYIVNELTKDLETDLSAKTYLHKRDKGKRNTYERKISVKSKEIASDLSKYGIIPRKSSRNDINFPSIDEEFMPSLLRGYFDGDGSICVHHPKDMIEPTYTISICGQEQIVLDIQRYLEKNNIKSSIVDMRQYGSNILNVRVMSIEDVYRFYNLIYNESFVNLDDFICIERKRYIFKQFIKDKIK